MRGKLVACLVCKTCFVFKKIPWCFWKKTSVFVVFLPPLGWLKHITCLCYVMCLSQPNGDKKPTKTLFFFQKLQGIFFKNNTCFTNKTSHRFPSHCWHNCPVACFAPFLLCSFVPWEKSCFFWRPQCRCFTPPPRHPSQGGPKNKTWSGWYFFWPEHFF